MKFHEIFTKKKYNCFEELEKEISKLATNKEEGDVFEQFVKLYFLLNRQFFQIKEVFLFSELPYELKKKLRLEKKDYGVDCVIIFNDNKIAGVQVKFRSKRELVTYRELSTFLSESFKTDYKYIVSNSYDIPKAVKKHKNIMTILVNTFEELDTLFFNELFNFVKTQKIKLEKYSPLSHQKRAIDNILKGFKENNRGKYISACGTGKTLTAMWVMENLNVKKTLFLVPSLALIKQTLESWSRNTNKGFKYLCVCSDRTVSSDLDEEDINVSEIGVPVTTNKDEIKEFISSTDDNIKVIFSTYQSINEVAEAVNLINNFEFDLVFFDEAHRTAGIKEESLFNFAVDDNNIKSKKKLFMTATERILTPRIKKKLEEIDRVVFSMDDVDKYGPIFERLSFGEAISKGIISDYKIVISAIEDGDILDLIQNNEFIRVIQDEKERKTTAINLFKQLMLIRAIKNYSIKKTIVFNSNIRSSKDFISDYKNNIDFNKMLIKELDIKESDLFTEHIDGTMNTGERTKIFDSFKKYKIGVISNARCLTEGVDVPIIDSVYFANPRTSVVDIVQASGRALRKGNQGNKIAYIIVPVILSYKDSNLDESSYEILYYIVQALRDQDERLADYIDDLNFNLAQGKPSNISSKKDDPFAFIVSKKIDINKFMSAISLRIAEHNSNPLEKKYEIKTYGKGDLKSGYKRIFKTVGDYQIPGYKKTVEETLKNFKNDKQKLNRKELYWVKPDGTIDHNNVSHTERLDLISKEGGDFKLTEVGKKLYHNQTTFEVVFRSIMLNKNEIQYYPYKTFLRILLKVGNINFLQFLYGVYTIQDTNESDINNSIKIIRELSKYNYNVLIAKEKNRKQILRLLNKKYGVNFTDEDLIMKTTAGNQFKYLGGHISLFKDEITFNMKEKIISVKDKDKLEKILKIT